MDMVLAKLWETLGMLRRLGISLLRISRGIRMSIRTWVGCKFLYPTREALKLLGFYELKHFTIQRSLLFFCGRSRYLSIGDLGSPNEMVMLICIIDEKTVTDMIVLHNYDYDGRLTTDKLNRILGLF